VWPRWASWEIPRLLACLLDAVEDVYGPRLAEKFAFENAYDFLRAELPGE